MSVMQQEYFGASNQRGEPDCCCLWTDVSEVPFAFPAHLPRRGPSHSRPANLTPSQSFVLKTCIDHMRGLHTWVGKSGKIQDFLKHAVYLFQTRKHLKDLWSVIYEMIYCVSDHLDTSYQWIIFLCHRKICFYPWPEPEAIINLIT